MASRKKRPVLYEVVERSRRQRETWKRPPTAAEPTAEGTQPRVAIAGESRALSRPRSIRFVGGKLYAELGWPGLSVVAVGVLLTLLVAFDAGGRYALSRHTCAAPATGDGASTEAVTDDAGATREPRAKVDRPPRIAAAPARKETTEPPPRVERAQAQQSESIEVRPGYHYVVIQHFRRSQEQAALSAGNYLIANGVDCFVMRGKDLRLIATRPFLLQQDDASARAAEQRRADELRDRVRVLGKEYAREHGYAFEQCYTRMLKRE